MKSVEKIDFKNTLASYTAKRYLIESIMVPPRQYIMIDGRGDPNTSTEFSGAIEALYPIAYKLKFASKQILGKDYVVMPLEGLWWSDDMDAFTSDRDKSKWNWTLMIMQPDWITREMFDAAVAKVAGKNSPKRLAKVRLQTYDEGQCVQTLHIGSFDDESEILKEMHTVYIPENGYKMSKKHHEIYFSDFRKTDPSKLKTILRQPVEKK